MIQWAELRGIRLALYQYEAVSEAIRQAGDFYEAVILDELRERFPVQRTIVDVGANVGNHSAYWSAFVPHTAIHAFEPVPSNYNILRLNLRGNPRAACHPTALSNCIGWALMEIDNVNMGRSRLAAGGTIRVAVASLDSFELEDVTLIKIDAEGHEPHVLAGARHTVARWHPAILVEDNDGRFDDHLAEAGVEGYRRTREWAGANSLWEWS